jgi:myo-inositol-1-phosphate synthase
MESRLGVLIIGSKGAVATTLLAAHCAAREGLAFRFALPSEVEPAYAGLELRKLEEMVFGGWDLVPESYSRSCEIHGVVPKHVIPRIAERMDQTDVYPAVLVGRDPTIERLLGRSDAQPRMKDVEYAPTVFTKRPLAEMVRSLDYDITDFRQKYELDRVIVVNLASTAKGVEPSEAHRGLEAFERGIAANDSSITSGMIYAYAVIKNGCSVINFTPSVMFDIPALVEFARQRKVALAGRDGKTGQTLYKTVIAPVLKHRALRLTGWYSTNILGNRDGQVLHDPEHRATKIECKSGVLDKIMGYDDFDHQVHIHYYPPRGDAKEAWDNVDFTGWFGVPMQMKINWLGDDSVLAAPLVCDLVRWVEFFSRRGEVGVLPQLAQYFKSPVGTEEHDFFRQIEMLRSHVRERYGAEVKVSI